MENSEFRLKEKTALIVGPLTRVHQTLANRLTQLGADVVMADQKIDFAQRFANQLMEAREINEKFGRAAAVAADLNSAEGAQDLIGRTAEFFGGVDIYIDGNGSAAPINFEESVPHIDNILGRNLRGTLLAASAVVPFLKGRKRGRLIFLLDEAVTRGYMRASLASAARSGLIGFATALARELSEFQITVNCVSMGLTEEFLLSAFPKTTSAQTALQEFRKFDPNAQITDPERIVETVAFLASPLAAGITGQNFYVRQNALGF